MLCGHYVTRLVLPGRRGFTIYSLRRISDGLMVAARGSAGPRRCPLRIASSAVPHSKRRR